MPRADIVVKLRAQRDFADDWRTTLAEEAADNIERLRSDVAAYKKDFRSIAEALNDPRCDLTHTMAELVAELRDELAELRKPDCRTCWHFDEHAFICTRATRIAICRTGEGYQRADPVRLYERGEE